jgi:hypothetical protein
MTADGAGSALPVHRALILNAEQIHPNQRTSGKPESRYVILLGQLPSAFPDRILHRPNGL